MNKSITTTADKFSSDGFVTLVPDLFRGKVAKDRETAGHLMSKPFQINENRWT